jgi:hypothetical protein
MTQSRLPPPPRLDMMIFGLDWVCASAYVALGGCGSDEDVQAKFTGSTAGIEKKRNMYRTACFGTSASVMWSPVITWPAMTWAVACMFAISELYA